MPIPYRDADDLNELGTAGYLKIEPSSAGSGYLGALFLINARGEPIEFTYNRIETPHTFLWRQADIRRHAERKLTASLLLVCPRTPQILLCLAEEVGSEGPELPRLQQAGGAAAGRSRWCRRRGPSPR